MLFFYGLFDDLVDLVFFLNNEVSTHLSCSSWSLVNKGKQEEHFNIS